MAHSGNWAHFMMGQLTKKFYHSKTIALYFSIADMGHVINVRLYCPTTDNLLKLVLTYT